jgi:hypothetical protein
VQNINFDWGMKAPLEKTAQELVEVGDLGYWPSGNAFCIFFGPTPASRGNEIRAASAVNVFGRIVGDPKVFSTIKDGEEVSVDGLL